MGPKLSKLKENIKFKPNQEKKKRILIKICVYLQGSQDKQNLFEILKKEINNYSVMIFNDEKELLAMIDLIKEDEKVLLVTSGKAAEIFFNKNKVDLTKIQTIYIDSARDKNWLKKFPSIKVVSSDGRSIIRSLINTIEELNQSYFFIQKKYGCFYHFNIQNNFQTYFYHNSILGVLDFESAKKHIYIDSHIEQARKDFIEFCEKNSEAFYLCEDSFKEDLLREIKNRTLDKEQLIYWFSRETFFSNMLNKILREDDLINFFKIRFIVFKLLEAFKSYQVKENPGILYRACKIHKDELKLFGKGKEIQLRGFNSASTLESEAFKFAERNKQEIINSVNENLLSVVFVIDTKGVNNTQYMFDIHKYFKDGDELEILLKNDCFSIIDRVVQSKNANVDYTIYCKLTEFQKLKNKMDVTTSKISQKIRNIYFEDSKLILCQMLNFMKKESELSEFLNENSDYIQNLESSELPVFYYFLGKDCNNKGDYDASLKYFNQSLYLLRNVMKKDDPNLASCYNNFGLVYLNKGDNKNALKYYNMSLDIRLKTLGNNHPSTATCYNNIGLVYKNKGDYENALKYFNLSLGIRIKFLGKDHPDTAASYNNIGLVYDNKGDYENALKYHNMSLEIKLKVLGSDHPDTATSYNNMGNAYNDKGDLENALKYYKMSLDIMLKVYGNDYPCTAASYNNIGCIYEDKGDYDNALKYYVMSLEILLKTLGNDHPDTATSYINIGVIYKAKKDYENALKCYNMGLEIFLKRFGYIHADTALCYNNIANVYDNKKDYDEALKYYNMSLEIIIKVLGNDHPVTATLYNNIGIVYSYMGDNENSSKYYNKSLGIKKKISGDDHSDTISMIRNIDLTESITK